MGHQKNVPHWIAYTYDFSRDGGAVSNISLTPVGTNTLLAGDVIKDFHGYCTEAVVGAAQVEVNTITLTGGPPVSGTLTVTPDYANFATVAWNETAANFQTSLRLLTGFEAVTVTGNFSTGFVITYVGTTGDQLIVASGNDLQNAEAGGLVATITETTAYHGVATVTLGNAASRLGYAANLKASLTTGAVFNRATVAGAYLWDDTNDHPIDYLVTTNNVTPSMSVGVGPLTAGAFKVIFEVYRP